MNLSERDQKIQRWLQLCQILEETKIEEMQLRQEISEYVLGRVPLEPTSRKLHLGNGYGLEATQNVNYKLDEFDRSNSVYIWLKNNGCYEDILKPDFKFSESKYLKAEPKFKTVVDEIVSFKIGAPTLKFISPEK